MHAHLRIDSGMYITVRNRQLTSSIRFVVVEKHSRAAKPRKVIQLCRAVDAGVNEYTLMADVDRLSLGTNTVLRFANAGDSWICADRHSAVFQISMHGAKIIDLPCFLAQRVVVNGNDGPVVIDSSADYVSRQQRLSFVNCGSGSAYVRCESRISLIHSPNLQLVTQQVQRPPRLASEWQQARSSLYAMSDRPLQLVSPPFVARGGMSMMDVDETVHSWVAALIGRNLLAPVTDETVPAPLACAQTALEERVSRLRQLAAIKGFVRTHSTDLLAWLQTARPQLVARIAAHDLAHAARCAADSMADVRVLPLSPPPSPAAVDAASACTLCCERMPALVICTQCRSGTICEECTDRLVLETRAECPFCRAAICAPAVWL
jgi:hypothetical protein